ncbi:MAG: TolC family protein [Bacteroidales bacterium]|nr:TolC family protein [Bacteroidales bacterium]
MKRFLSIFVMLGTAVVSLFAQQAQETQPSTLRFTLEQAQEYALEHSRTLQNSALSVRQAEADKWTSIASMLPQVNATLDYSNSLGYKMELGAMSISMPPSGSLGVNVAMALSGAQIVSTQLAKVSVEMANVQKLQTEQDIVQQVKLLYFSALVSHQTQHLLEESLETIKKLYDFVSKSVEVGVAEKVDADQILVQVATMETTLNTSKRSLEMVYNSLRLAMNIPFNVEIELSQSLDDLLNVEESLKLLYDDFILENNYSYQLAQKGVALTKHQKNMTAWTYGPTLSAFYQYSGKHYFSDEARMNMTPPNMIGVSLSIPIFSSGRNFETVRKANIEYKKQLNSLSDTEMALNIQHRQLKYNLSSAYERFETQKRSVEVSQSVFENISKKYEFGLSSSLDVTNSATNLLSAQSSYVQAILEYVNAQIELEKLLNKNY